jgi:hypothetical protein
VPKVQIRVSGSKSYDLACSTLARSFFVGKARTVRTDLPPLVCLRKSAVDLCGVTGVTAFVAQLSLIAMWFPEEPFCVLDARPSA